MKHRLATACALVCLGCAPRGADDARAPALGAATTRPVSPAAVGKPPPSGAFVALTDDAYGGFKYAPNAPHIGEPAPAIEALLSTGDAFSLAQALQSQRVLVLFYRGDW